MDSHNAMKKLHFLLFPWLAQGHINPFLELSKALAIHGHTVSFLSTPVNISRIKPSLQIQDWLGRIDPQHSPSLMIFPPITGIISSMTSGMFSGRKPANNMPLLCLTASPTEPLSKYTISGRYLLLPLFLPFHLLQK